MRTLRGQSVHAYATSIIVLDRIPEMIREGLTLKGQGLGKLLQRSGLESRRDLLWWGLKRPERFARCTRSFGRKTVSQSHLPCRR